jgi:hypothetical protein
VVGDEAVRRRIEEEFNGIHEFVPSYRGDCRPYRFAGTHPKPILRDMDQLKAELGKQLALETGVKA